MLKCISWFVLCKFISKNNPKWRIYSNASSTRCFKLLSLHVYEGHLKASPSSNRPNWPGCEDWRRRRRWGFFFPPQIQFSMVKKKEREGERERQCFHQHGRSRAAIIQLFSPLSYHKYASSFLHLLTDTSNEPQWVWSTDSTQIWIFSIRPCRSFPLDYLT